MENNRVNFIMSQLPEYVFKFILKVGSSLFSDSPKDEDYLCVSNDIVESSRKKFKFENRVLDVILITEQEYHNKINFIDIPLRHTLYNYQIPISEVIYKEEGYNIEPFKMFDESIKLKYLYTAFLNYKYTLQVSRQKPVYVKAYTHYYMIHEMYKNGKEELTTEIIANVNKLRKKLPGYMELIEELDEEFIETFNNVYNYIIENNIIIDVPDY